MCESQKLKQINTEQKVRPTKVNEQKCHILYVQEVVTQPKILNRTILSNRIHVT